jgi:hypothetical protein
MSSALAVDNMMLLYAASSSSSRRSERKSRCAILPYILGLEGKQCPNPSYGKGHLSGYPNPNAPPKLECPILPWNLGVLKEDLDDYYDTWWQQCSEPDEVPLTIGYIFVGMLYLGAALAGIARGLAM